MAVSGVAATSTAASATSRASIANNFDTFLLLLTTQLKNQNPLDPLDTNQFTQQLVQFAGVEQQIRSNESLEALVNLNKTSQLSTAMNYVGATVTAEGATSALKSGVATWYVTAPRPASATINVSDASGNVVFTHDTTLEAGTNGFSWDGKMTNGQTAPGGKGCERSGREDLHPVLRRGRCSRSVGQRALADGRHRTSVARQGQGGAEADSHELAKSPYFTALFGPVPASLNASEANNLLETTS